jgi:hypothetical protein
MKAPSQIAMHCACGRADILAHGLCPTCYTLKRQDAAYFGGLREEVLKRDNYTCRGCGAPGRAKRSITVHHRVPGVSKLHLMISLCPKCHAIVERTQMVLAEMNPVLLILWREQHPNAPEQLFMDFKALPPQNLGVGLFDALLAPAPYLDGEEHTSGRASEANE